MSTASPIAVQRRALYLMGIASAVLRRVDGCGFSQGDTHFYDGAECDASCLAEDLEVAASELALQIEKPMGKVAFVGSRTIEPRNQQTLSGLLGAQIKAQMDRAAFEPCHGGAEGFDTMVGDAFAGVGIKCRVIRPDYSRHPYKFAPVCRNLEIVKGAEAVIAYARVVNGAVTDGTMWGLGFARHLYVPMSIIVFDGARVRVLDGDHARVFVRQELERRPKDIAQTIERIEGT